MATVGYVTTEELTAYATARGITLSGDLSALLTLSLDYIETRCYNGVKTDPAQTLQFPRTLCGSYGSNYYPINRYPQGYSTWGTCQYDNTTVPTEIKTAQMEGAILVDQGVDLQPTIGQSLKRMKLGTMEKEYQDGSQTGVNRLTKLNDILRPFLANSMKVTRA